MGLKSTYEPLGHCSRMHAELVKYVEKHHPGGQVAPGAFYIASDHKLKFIDASGNEFRATPGNVKSGKWSPYEVKLVRDKDWHMSELSRITANRGGCIAPCSTYQTAQKKMIFVDVCGNQFDMTSNNLKNGQWSPYEHRNNGAQTRLSSDGKLKIVKVASGDLVIYALQDDGTVRIRSHIDASGTRIRKWIWGAETPTIEMVEASAPGISENEFLLELLT